MKKTKKNRVVVFASFLFALCFFFFFFWSNSGNLSAKRKAMAWRGQQIYSIVDGWLNNLIVCQFGIDIAPSILKRILGAIDLFLMEELLARTDEGLIRRGRRGGGGWWRRLSMTLSLAFVLSPAAAASKESHKKESSKNRWKNLGVS